VAAVVTAERLRENATAVPLSLVMGEHIFGASKNLKIGRRRATVRVECEHQHQWKHKRKCRNHHAGKIAIKLHNQTPTLPCVASEPRGPAPPWTIEEHNDACFIARDKNRQGRAS